MALKPNGQPADGSNGTPLSPLTGGGILGTGFGVTIDPQGSVWFGNFGWGNDCDWLRSIPDGKRKRVALHADRHAGVTA